MSDMDDLLDGTLDDLSDMPAFKPFPVGAYKMKLSFEEKPVNDIPSVELKLTIAEVAELEGEVAEADMPKPGDSQNILYMLKTKEGKTNELGQGQLKDLLKVIAPAFPEARTSRQIMQAAKDFEVLMVTAQRTDKNDKDKKYTTIKHVELI